MSSLVSFGYKKKSDILAGYAGGMGVSSRTRLRCDCLDYCIVLNCTTREWERDGLSVVWITANF